MPSTKDESVTATALFDNVLPVHGLAFWRARPHIGRAGRTVESGPILLRSSPVDPSELWRAYDIAVDADKCHCG